MRDELLAILQNLMEQQQQVIDNFDDFSEHELLVFQNYFTETMLQLNLALDQIGRGETPDIPILDKSMDSSVINAFKFDPKKGNLLVQFKGKFPNEEGSIYSYGGVSPQIFNVFKKGAVPARSKGKNSWGFWYPGKNPSMGSGMNVLLKEMGYPYQKLT